MKTSIVIFMLALISPLSALAENHSETKTKFKERAAIKVDYFGELVMHPGLSVGLDYTLAQSKVVTLHWDTDLGGFWHRWNNSSAFLKTSIGARVAMGSAFVDANLGAGYMHSWAAGSIYQRAEDGSVEKANNEGHPHFMPTFSFLLGWDGSRKYNLPWSVHLGVEIYLQYPYNHIFLPHVAAKVGFTYKLKHQ